MNQRLDRSRDSTHRSSFSTPMNRKRIAHETREQVEAKGHKVYTEIVQLALSTLRKIITRNTIYGGTNLW